MKKFRGLRRHWRNELKQLDKKISETQTSINSDEIFITQSFPGRKIKRKNQLEMISKLKNIVLTNQDAIGRKYLLMIDTEYWSDSSILIFDNQTDVTNFFRRKNYHINIEKIINSQKSTFDEWDTFLLTITNNLDEHSYFIDSKSANQYLVCNGSFVEDIYSKPYKIIIVATTEIINLGKQLLS